MVRVKPRWRGVSNYSPDHQQTPQIGPGGRLALLRSTPLRKLRCVPLRIARLPPKLSSGTRQEGCGRGSAPYRRTPPKSARTSTWPGRLRREQTQVRTRHGWQRQETPYSHSMTSAEAHAEGRQEAAARDRPRPLPPPESAQAFPGVAWAPRTRSCAARRRRIGECHRWIKAAFRNGVPTCATINKTPSSNPTYNQRRGYLSIRSSR